MQRDVDALDSAAMAAAIRMAPRPTRARASSACKSIIGYGSPNRAGTSKVHGEPLGEDELKATKENLGLAAGARFYIPDDVPPTSPRPTARGAAVGGALW